MGTAHRFLRLLLRLKIENRYKTCRCQRLAQEIFYHRATVKNLDGRTSVFDKQTVLDGANCHFDR